MGENRMDGIRVTPEAVHDLERCPVCGSSDFMGRSIVVEGDMAFQDLECVRCGTMWYEAYSIHHRCVRADDLPEGVSPEEIERAAADPSHGSAEWWVDLVTVQD